MSGGMIPLPHVDENQSLIRQIAQACWQMTVLSFVFVGGSIYVGCNDLWNRLFKEQQNSHSDKTKPQVSVTQFGKFAHTQTLSREVLDHTPSSPNVK